MKKIDFFDNINWLKSLCTKYTNGECRSTECAERGGFNASRKKTNNLVHFTTCHAHETIKQIEKLEEDRDDLKSRLNSIKEDFCL